LAKFCIIDASVSLKWYFDDEECVDSARRLLNDYGNGQITIIVPNFFFAEVANALNVAVIRKRLKEKKAFEFLQNILELNILTLSDSNLLLLAWRFARTYNCSVYDTTYIAGAYNLGCNIYTGDRKLYNTLGTKLSLVKWIGDYSYIDLQDE